MPAPAEPPSSPMTSMPTSQVVIPPEAQQELPKKESFHIPTYVIIIIVVYVLGLYGFLGYTIYKKNTKTIDVNTVTAPAENTPPQLPQLIEPTKTIATTPQGFSMKESTKLQLIDVSTPFATWYESTATATYVDFVVPKDLNNKVMMYRYSDFSFVAPKNWYGTVRSNTTDGTYIQLFPTTSLDDSAQSVKVYISDPSPKDGVATAYPFSPWIRDHAIELGIDRMGLEPAPSFLTVTNITPRLFSYSNAYDILELQAILFTDADQHPDDQQWVTMFMEVRMFKENRAFAEQLINTFISQYDLKNR